MSYWEERTLETMLAGEKSAQQLIDELKDLYAQTKDDLTKEMRLLYQEMVEEQTKRGVTPALYLEEKMNKKELATLKSLLFRYRKEADKLNLSKEYKNRLRILTAKAKISRLEELDITLQRTIEYLHHKYEGMLEEHLCELYAESFYKTAYNGAIYTGVGKTLNKFSPSQLEAIVTSEWYERNFRASVWEDRSKLIAKLKVAVRKIVLQGNPLDVVSKELADEMRTSYRNAVRLVTTETNKICNDALSNCYTDILGCDYYVYLATLDFKTSEVCRGLDGKKFKLENAQIGVNRPPMHPHCRSCIKPEVDKVVDSTTRIARDSNGNNIYVPASTTYYEWFNKYVR